MNNKNKEGLKIRGFYRIQISEDDGKIVGDSGWKENQVTNLGFNNYLVKTLGAIAGSAQISHMALGTGGAPAAGDTSLGGEVVTNGSSSVVRSAVTAASSSSSKTVRFTATFASANSFITAAANISNVGLFNVSGPTTASGSLFAGNTYTSSSCATNQNVKSLRHFYVNKGRKLREFGENLEQIIPSRASTVKRKVYRLCTKHPNGVEDIVRSSWGHEEIGRNDQSYNKFLL